MRFLVLLLVIPGLTVLWIPAVLTVIPRLLGSHDTVIRSEPTVLNSQWQTIEASRPFVATNRRQSVLLEIPHPLVMDSVGWDFRLADGSVIRPEVVLVDMDGVEFPLEGYSYLKSSRYGVDMLKVTGDGFPDGKTFRAVRVRSDRPVTVNLLVWSCWNSS